MPTTQKGIGSSILWPCFVWQYLAAGTFMVSRLLADGDLLLLSALACFSVAAIAMPEPHSPSMILIASEQVWPNLNALVHWSLLGDGIGSIHILHTTANQSQGPALRLQQVLKAAKGTPFRYRQLAPLTKVGTSPAEVADAVGRLIRKESSCNWVVVANGGLKTMTLGLLEAMGSPHVQVVYAEIGAGWQQVVNVNGSIQTVPLPGIASEDMDKLPVVSLIEAQIAADPQGVRLAPQNVEAMDVAKVVRACITGASWDWRGGFAALTGSQIHAVGPLFERWCGALLMELGVRNVIAGLEVRTADSGTSAAESDLLAIHHGRFFYFELKLINEDTPDRETLVEILRKATSHCRNFAGSGGQPVLLLPNWLLKPSDHELISLFQPRPVVLDATDSPHLISWLANLLGQTVPPALAELEDEIIAWVEKHQATRAFGSEPRCVQMAREEGDGPVSKIAPFCNELRTQRQQNWLLLEDYDTLRFQICLPTGDAVPSGFSRKGRHCEMMVRMPEQSAMQNLRAAFRPAVNKAPPVDEMLGKWTRWCRESGIRAVSRTSGDPTPTPASAPKPALPQGKRWKLQQKTDSDGTCIWVLRVEGKLNGFSKEMFPEAVARVEVRQSSPGEPRQRTVYFRPGAPVHDALSAFHGRDYDGAAMAGAVRDKLAANSI